MLRVHVVEAGFCTDYHDMGACLDPMVASGGLLGIRVHVAGIGATCQHVHKANLTHRRCFVAHPSFCPFQSGLVHTHRIGAGSRRIIGHTGKGVIAFSQGAHLSIGTHRHNGGRCTHFFRRCTYCTSDGLLVSPTLDLHLIGSESCGCRQRNPSSHHK
ncbi:hypothetical protein D3C71_1595830 [compost metagenome]